MRTMTVAAGAIAMLLAGCAAETPLIDRILVMDGAFDPLTCKEVVAGYHEAQAPMGAPSDAPPAASAAAWNASTACVLGARKHTCAPVSAAAAAIAGR